MGPFAPPIGPQKYGTTIVITIIRFVLASGACTVFNNFTSIYIADHNSASEFVIDNAPSSRSVIASSSVGYGGVIGYRDILSNHRGRHTYKYSQMI